MAEQRVGSRLDGVSDLESALFTRNRVLLFDKVILLIKR
jgi:hypothetical protein